MNNLIQSLEAQKQFNELYNKVDRWLETHPSCYRIQGSIQIDHKDLHSFVDTFGELIGGIKLY